MVSKVVLRVEENVVCVGSHYVGWDRDHPKRGIDRQGFE
jgi:hypothetical protein